jgi:hypothetical protein
MIEIQCPRCEQYWYSNEDEGRVRLCSRCVDHLRLKRGPRAEIDFPFIIGVCLFVAFDALMIALTALLPELFGKVMMVVGIIMLVAGWAIFRVLQLEGGLWAWVFPFGGDIDWSIGRWAIALYLSGLFLTAACGSLVGLAR